LFADLLQVPIDWPDKRVSSISFTGDICCILFPNAEKVAMQKKMEEVRNESLQTSLKMALNKKKVKHITQETRTHHTALSPVEEQATNTSDI
ncbi:hypothetical protein QE152_g39090, partial [Popillia japonica]